MDIDLITGIATLLGGGVVYVLSYPAKKKAENLKNEASSAAQWKELYIESKQDSKEKSEKIDSLYTEIGQHRDRCDVLTKEKACLEVENTTLKMIKCVVVKCPKRDPQTEY